VIIVGGKRPTRKGGRKYNITPEGERIIELAAQQY
jgi:hypothetical protein